MYSYVNEELVYKWTSADDLNTLRFGMTGMDKMAGTADDYTVEFSLASDCSQAVVEVNLEQPAVGGDLEPGSLAVVIADVTGVPEPPNPTQHFLMRPFGARPRINLRLNDRIEWDYELVSVMVSNPETRRSGRSWFRRRIWTSVMLKFASPLVHRSCLER